MSEEPGVLLDVRALEVRFPLRASLADRARRRPAGAIHAIDGLDLRLAKGEAFGLVGESGCGKSTLARCVAGIQQPTGGEMRFRGERLEGRSGGTAARRVQMVFQDPFSSLNPRMTAEQTIGELLRAHRIVPPGDVAARCAALLEMVGLRADDGGALPRQLSGGQRQRVALARALALEPDLLVADEPTSALDVSVQAAVLNLLADLRVRLGLTLLFISHDISVVRHLCDRVGIMYLGRIVEEGPTEQVLSDPRHPYTAALLRAVPRLTPRDRSGEPAVRGDPPSPADIPAGCRFHPRCPAAQDVCRRDEPAFIAAPAAPEHRAACHFALNGAARVGRDPA
jgi:oligopeptide/dipeptide ABC transporter ATP-binding protein